MRSLKTRAPTLEPAKELAAEYCHAIERMRSFSGVPQPEIETAIHWLMQWKSDLDATGLSLPAPWVFADRQGAIEFEWETPNGDLTVSLASNSQCWHSLSLRESESEEGLLAHEHI